MAERSRKIKVALLGSFPIYPFRRQLKYLYSSRPTLVTSWNLNLVRGLGTVEGLEAHFLVSAPVLKTQILDINGVKVHFLARPPKVNLLDQFTQLQFSRWLFGHHLRRLNPDLVHGIGTDHETAYVAQSSGWPYVITVHGVMKEVVRKISVGRFHIYRTFARFEQQVMCRATDVIAISNYVRKSFSDVNGIHFYSVPNAVASVFFEQTLTPKHDLLFVAIIRRGKRLLNLLKALHRLRERGESYRLVVAGQCSDRARWEEIKDFVVRHGLEKTVDFRGHQSQEQIAGLMAQSKLLVLPSIEENTPMVIAEAMAVGIPVVATRVGGVPEMVRDGQTGFLVPPDDIDALAEAIHRVLKDEQVREKMGRQAKQLALQTYHPEQVAQKTYEVYRQVLERTQHE